MIKYALTCETDHNWDAWFSSISGYGEQLERGLVECPYCGSPRVQKAPMAPSVVTSKAQSRQSEQKSDDPSSQNMPVTSEDINLSLPEPMKALFAQMKEQIEKSHDYVGDTFAREARAMHEGETQVRPIYGEATAREVQALVEDEIPVLPLPALASPKGSKTIN
jgi:hypothetical protein